MVVASISGCDQLKEFKMNIVRLFLLGAALATAAAPAISFAQETPLYDGKWSAAYNDQTGKPRQAELVLKGQSGTWKVFSKGAEIKLGNACVDHEFPVAV